jgi:hypothetical protein
MLDCWCSVLGMGNLPRAYRISIENDQDLMEVPLGVSFQKKKTGVLSVYLAPSISQLLERLLPL